jgi:hypothetical protein
MKRLFVAPLSEASASPKNAALSSFPMNENKV